MQLIAIRGIIDHVISGKKSATVILVSILVGLVVLQRLGGLAMSARNGVYARLFELQAAGYR